MTKSLFFEKWVPDIDMPNAINIEAIHDDYEGFRIVVRGTGRLDGVFSIRFKDHVAYRNMDESDRYQTLKNFPYTCNEWCLYSTKESEFINWIIVESGGRYKQNELIHFLIITQNDVLDIISSSHPEIEEL